MIENPKPPVTSFNFNFPMSWETFNQLPAQAQVDYVAKLRKEYKCNARQLAKMFGCKTDNVMDFLHVNSFDTGGIIRQREDRKKAWEAFVALPPGQVKTEPKPEPVEDPVQAAFKQEFVEAATEAVKQKFEEAATVAPTLIENDPAPMPSGLVNSFHIDISGRASEIWPRVEAFLNLFADQDLNVIIYKEELPECLK